VSGRTAVTYLWNRDCPSHEAGLALLRAAAAGAGVEIDLVSHEVTDDEEARSRRFPGSPTYVIGGTDPFPPPTGVPFAAQACRAYPRADGSVGPLPDRGALEGALRAATRPR
jgi:hypothetical protein